MNIVTRNMIKNEIFEQDWSNIQSSLVNKGFTEEDKGFQSKEYFLTFHIKEPDTFEQAFNRVESLSLLCENYIFAEEYGKSGTTPHIQGAFRLKTKQRAQKLNKDYFLGKATLYKLKDYTRASLYCSKEGGKKITSDKIKRPKKFLSKDQLLPWELLIDNEILPSVPNDREIFWFFSKEGNMGKTTFCKYLQNKWDACIIGGKSADSKNCIATYIANSTDKRAPEVVICPIPKSFDMDYVSYEAIEMIKDMFFYSGKYEGCCVNDNSPHMICFANEPPNMDKLSNDRWTIYEILDNVGNYELYGSNCYLSDSD